MYLPQAKARGLLALCALSLFLQICHGLEYEILSNGTSPQAVTSKQNSSIPIFEDPVYAGLVSDWLTSQNRDITPGRIDTHHHYIPDFYARYLGKYNYTGLNLPWGNISWSADASLQFMDSLGIQMAIISISTPGIPYGPREEVTDIARRVNEYGANVTKAHPGKFGFFAALPIPYMNDSVAEIGHALDVLNASGITVMANLHGKYLGDQQYEPMWAELDRRGAVLFVHPNALPCPLAEGISSGVVDFLCDSSRTVASMLQSNILARYTRVKVIIPHAGGYIPYQAERVATSGSGGVSDGPQRMAQLKRLYFDTAMSGNMYTLPSLMAFTDGHKVTFGSDFPFAPNGTAMVTVNGLNKYFAADPMTLWSIGRGNALKLIPTASSLASS